MQNFINDFRIQAQQPLINPQTLIAELPLTSKVINTVHQARTSIDNIMQELDHRLLVVVGPCSIHDRDAALEYAALLSDAAKQFADDLLIVMRVYFEKPRTTLGWKGLISDPYLDGSFDMNHGLRYARKILLDINEMNLPAATEFLDSFIPHYLQDLIAWCAIGARTSESQIHRELASGLPMPVGFKNSTDGNIQIAIDGMHVARQTHPLLTINKSGIPSILTTKGNPSCHLVLRGSTQGPNFSREHVELAAQSLQHRHLPQNIIIDCSHGNSMKMHTLQKRVVNDVISQINQGSKAIKGVMLESNLVEGKQTLAPNSSLTYGQSITDACMGWSDTLACLELLAKTKK